MNNQDMKQQAQYIWNRLDDLAATDPNAYKKFIEDQMKERELYNSNPDPKLCVYTKTEKEGFGWFINICGWKRIPYPKDDAEPLKLWCGFKQKLVSKDGCSDMAVPVATNDQIVDELIQLPFDKVDFIKLILKFVEKEQKIKLKDNFEICQDIYKGVFPADPKRLFDKNPQQDLSESSVRELLKGNSFAGETLSSPESLLKTLSSENDAQESNIKTDYVENALNVNNKQSKILVEEIGNQVKKPEYSLKENEDGNIVVKIILPGVQSSSECDLTISQTQVELDVTDMYSLQISLPSTVDEESAKAKFIKKSSVLTLTMPVLK